MSSPVFFRIRGRGWYYILVLFETAILSEPWAPYHGPCPSLDAAEEDAANW